jgi:hypothetical protein
MKQAIRTRSYELDGYFSLEYPEAWFVEEELFEDAKFVILSPKARDFELGLGFSIIYGASSEFLVLDGSDPMDLLQSFALGGTDAELGRFVQFTQGEVTWVRAKFKEMRGGGQTKGWMACAVVEDGFVILVASAPSGRWTDYEQTFGVMFESLTLR